METGNRKKINGKLIIAILVVFASFFAAQLVILLLLSADIIGVVVAMILTVAVIIAMMSVMVGVAWSLLNPILAVFDSNLAAGAVNDKLKRRIDKLASRDDDIGAMIRKASSMVNGLASGTRGIKIP